jgi:hypothetical protein
MMDKLIDNLNNKEKVLAIHAILSNSIEPFGSKLKYEYHYWADEIDYTTYSYNSFSWIQYKDGTKEIKEAEIDKIVNIGLQRKVWFYFSISALSGYTAEGLPFLAQVCRVLSLNFGKANTDC